jgi:alpha-galactosidase
MDSVVDIPDAIFVLSGDTAKPAWRHADRFGAPGVDITLRTGSDRLAIGVSAPTQPLSRIVLRWRRPMPANALVLGDAWERGYGDLQWRSLQPERILPWSWLAYDPATGRTWGAGVRVRPATFCSWRVDEDGVSLWLDLRNGGGPVRLGSRVLPAATVVSVEGGPDESPLSVQRRLAAEMCPDPIPAAGPVVGCNNWYYAYGVDFTPAHILRDADTIASLAGGHAVRPFTVVDAGWSAGGGAPGGPWTEGLPGTFDDLPGLASKITDRGSRPGIWIRPTALSFVDAPDRLRSGPHTSKEKPLDITTPENLESVRSAIQLVRGWGFELIKHDFSTFDAFGRFGDTMGDSLTEAGWHWQDESLTNAEILLRLYGVIREAAGDAVVIGCNTVGQLAAGLVDVQRVGDDTSGRQWERTRRMGVNSLAFRLAQHRTFFTVDADCVPATPATPWEKNRQFLDLVARSGTALMVSVDPAARNPGVDADLRAALRIALDGGEPGGVEPLDWMASTSPRHWRVGDGTRTYDWLEESGALPLGG